MTDEDHEMAENDERKPLSQSSNSDTPESPSLTQPYTQRKTIRELSPDTIHSLGATVNVNSISHCVKELVENALDAGATSLDVRLEGSGYNSIQVTDNGHGIRLDDLEDMFKKNYTSKLDDDGIVRKYGFRGIFLHSLCGVCSEGEIEVITKTADENMGTKITVDNDGAVIHRSSHQCNIGTIIVVKNIFSKIPVRRQHAKQTLSKEVANIDTILHEYSLICTNAKFTLRNNEKNSGNDSTLFNKTGTKSTSSSICTVFGTRLYGAIKQILYEDENLKLEAQVPASPEKASDARSKDTKGNRLFIYLNHRPVDYDKLQKLIKDIYAKHLGNKNLFGYFNIEIDPASIDVNFNPDKRKIILSREAEKAVLERVEKMLLGLYDPTAKKVVLLPPKPKSSPKASPSSVTSDATPPPSDQSTPNRFKRTTPLSALPEDLESLNETSKTIPPVSTSYIITYNN
jgi:DNA mismatch repair protein PMS2